MTVDTGGETVDLTVDLKQTDSGFIGTVASYIANGSIEKGTVAGSSVKATLQADVQGQPMTITLDGKVDGEKMSGTLNVPGIGIVSFTAVRTK